MHLGVVLLNDEQEQKIGVRVKLPAECYMLMEVLCSVGMCPMSQMVFFFDILCLTVWGVEPDVTHQTSWLVHGMLNSSQSSMPCQPLKALCRALQPLSGACT